MAEYERVICAADDLADGGKGVRFELGGGSERVPGFAVRYRGKVYAYRNRCAHVGIELDWMDAQFFDASGLYLVCSTHGALYLPDTGECCGGPCRGARLTRIEVTERDDKVFIQSN